MSNSGDWGEMNGDDWAADREILLGLSNRTLAAAAAAAEADWSLPVRAVRAPPVEPAPLDPEVLERMRRRRRELTMNDFERIMSRIPDDVQGGRLHATSGELSPETIEALLREGLKVEPIIHNEREGKRYCCDNCYRTHIMRISWGFPTSPHFREAQINYHNELRSEIVRMLDLMDTATMEGKNFTIAEGYGDPHWLADETVDFLVKLGCTCDYIDDISYMNINEYRNAYRSYRISWSEPRNPWAGAYDSIHSEIMVLIDLVSQAANNGQTEFSYHVVHEESIQFLQEKACCTLPQSGTIMLPT